MRFLPEGRVHEISTGNRNGENMRFLPEEGRESLWGFCRKKEARVWGWGFYRKKEGRVYEVSTGSRKNEFIKFLPEVGALVPWVMLNQQLPTINQYNLLSVNQILNPWVRFSPRSIHTYLGFYIRPMKYWIFFFTKYSKKKLFSNKAIIIGNKKNPCSI